MAGRERVAITGLGIVSSLGIGREETFARLAAGERGIGPVSLFDSAGLRSRIVGEVRGLDVAAIAPQCEAADWSRSDALALLAA
ncbi:MAG TPA: beta-ketoacyl synthase N-terminal-like domain-containing protein, partial [Polyangiaceae bacterium]